MVIYNIIMYDTEEEQIELNYYVTIENKTLTYELKENKTRCKKQTFNNLINNLNLLCYNMDKHDIKEKTINNDLKQIQIKEC